MSGDTQVELLPHTHANCSRVHALPVQTHCVPVKHVYIVARKLWCVLCAQEEGGTKVCLPHALSAPREAHKLDEVDWRWFGLNKPLIQSTRSL